MTGQTETRFVRQFTQGWKIALGLGLLAAPVGFGLSILGFGGWWLGPLTIIAGLIGWRIRAERAAWVVWVGVALTLGALTYITLALLRADGPSSGGGSGTGMHAMDISV
ncbi:hypothetical protein EK0264_08200 [Epidermidibacterium keratini]|uniref:Uncharacterized protein n=1 Tax=Epidermidibacterium keratini TaxID=1891644 RepID=A0A7L4YLW1_9ACTN|nr:hypothetical protein [Epidermidibacterium keratini]QHC00261.1 hypothetical protein EK0264_08200 [Epidermidibacterium keratini]